VARIVYAPRMGSKKKIARKIVPVAFPAALHRQIAAAATRAGEYTSEWIRHAAMRRLQQEEQAK
jgi:hypothetical protein